MLLFAGADKLKALFVCPAEPKTPGLLLAGTDDPNVPVCPEDPNTPVLLLDDGVDDPKRPTLLDDGVDDPNKRVLLLVGADEPKTPVLSDPNVALFVADDPKTPVLSFVRADDPNVGWLDPKAPEPSVVDAEDPNVVLLVFTADPKPPGLSGVGVGVDEPNVGLLFVVDPGTDDPNVGRKPSTLLVESVEDPNAGVDLVKEN